MKTAALVLLALFAFATASPAKPHLQTVRRFLPEENDPYRITYLLIRDDNGTLHFEDLTNPVTPRKVTIDDVTVYLYTQNNVEDHENFKTANLSGLQASQVFDPKKKNYFIIHGLYNNYESALNVVIKKAILTKADANVFVIDWSRLSNKLYTIAKAAVPQIGVYVGDFINKMMKHYTLTTSDFRLIGHSLGAHVAGCAGAEVEGLVEYIVGLDPAGPLFSLSNTSNRLDATDGDFVQIIHTSSTTLGFRSSIGDSDLYPNNGAYQPGCGIDLIGTCAHSRSYYLLEESILTGGFTALQCNSYKAFKNGDCINNDLSYLGSLNIDVAAHGDYYLDTGKASPYSLS